MVFTTSMMDLPVVSVVIPAYQSAEWIAETLDSVLSQTFLHYEIIVVNDGSPDTIELEETLKPYRDRIMYLRQENRGPAAARNTGIRAARGRYVAPLDDDDLWEPEFLATQVAILDADPALDLVYADALVFGAETGTTMGLSGPQGEVTFAQLVLEENVVVHCTTVARRETLLRAGLYDEAVLGTDDFELWLRLAKLGARIHHNRRILARHRLRAGSLSTYLERMAESVLQVLTKAEEYPGLTSVERGYIERRRRAERAELNLLAGKNAAITGDAEVAIDYLARANTHFRRRKLSAAILLLRVSPRLVKKLYLWRNRYIVKQDNRRLSQVYSR